MTNNLKKYNYILNENSGEIFPVTDFYLYPLTVNDYADLYRNYKDDTTYPAMAFMYLTNVCTDNCVGCFAKAIEDGHAFLEKNVISNVLKDLADHGTKAIKLAGREPSASPYLSHCLDTSRELGLKSLVISSGANIDKHKESLSNSCTHLRLSLNTINQDLHNSMHRPTEKALQFNNRIKVAKEIIEKRRKNDLITGATYLVRTSADKIGYEYAKMCKDMGFNYVRFTVLDDQKGEWSDEWRYLYNKILGLETEEFKVITHNPIPSKEIFIKNYKFIDPAIISRVVIHGNGKVNSCHEGWRGKWEIDNMATFGNVNEQSFNEIWCGEKRKRFLSHIRDTHKKGLEEFKKCIEGNGVCSHNCKYDGFNTVQKWIISQLEKDINTTFKEICVESAWK